MISPSSLSVSDHPGDLSALSGLHRLLRTELEEKIGQFSAVGNSGDLPELFMELCFCLFTPQSGARACWDSVVRIRDAGLLFTGAPERLHPFMKGVRFHITKAQRLVEARDWAQKDQGLAALRTLGETERRAVLVREVKGLGFKESSHFLRNIGWGFNLAILDRHILRRLTEYQVISEIPDNLTADNYLKIEQSMQKWAEHIQIPMGHLDLLLWYQSKQELFK